MGCLQRAARGEDASEGGATGAGPMCGPQPPSPPSPTGVSPGRQKQEEVLLPGAKCVVPEEPPLRQPMGVHMQIWDPCLGPSYVPLGVLLRISAMRCTLLLCSMPNFAVVLYTLLYSCCWLHESPFTLLCLDHTLY